MVVLIALILLLVLIIVTIYQTILLIINDLFKMYLNRANKLNDWIFNKKRFIVVVSLIVVTIVYRINFTNIVRNHIDMPHYTCASIDAIKSGTDELDFVIIELIKVEKYDVLKGYFGSSSDHDYMDMYVYKAKLQSQEEITIINYQPIHNNFYNCDQVDLYKEGNGYHAWGVYSTDNLYDKYGTTFIVVVD